MPDSGIDFDLDGIGHQLADRLLGVPTYQRSYAWRDDQVDDFCTDLKNAFGSAPQEYFMGTVVLSKEGADGRDTIIDGQQRLATATMLLAAIRDHFRAHGEDPAANSVHQRYIGSYDDEVDAYIPRLALNADDNEFFRLRIVEGDLSAIPSRESHRLIEAARIRLADFVQELADAAGPGNRRARMVDWRKFVEERVRVIHVTVPTESDAFMIFETLNDRGADLTLADLLKNYLFGRSGAAKLEEVKQHWLLAQAALDMNIETFIAFIRHFWSSRYGAVRERELYKKIKERVTSQPQALTFAKELEEAARLYAALLSSEHEYWTGWGSTTEHNIETLGRLALEQNRPMLLATLQHMTKAQAKKVLKASVSWSVRGLIVGGIGGGVTEKAYCDAAVKIRAGTIKTAPQLLTELTSIVPGDAVFKEAFETARVTKATLARYYLNALELGHSHAAQPELVPNSNEEEVNLEHVLPKNATAAEWNAFTAEERRPWADRIGNMALLAKAQNGRIGNKSFAVKRPILKASQLALTSAIGAESSWTTAEIAARQKQLAALALTVWKRSP